MSGSGRELPWKRVRLRRGLGMRPPNWLSAVSWQRHFPWARPGIQPLSSSSTGTFLSGWQTAPEQPPVEWMGVNSRPERKVPAEVRAAERRATPSPVQSSAPRTLAAPKAAPLAPTAPARPAPTTPTPIQRKPRSAATAAPPKAATPSAAKPARPAPVASGKRPQTTTTPPAPSKTPVVRAPAPRPSSPTSKPRSVQAPPRLMKAPPALDWSVRGGRPTPLSSSAANTFAAPRAPLEGGNAPLMSGPATASRPVGKATPPAVKATPPPAKATAPTPKVKPPVTKATPPAKVRPPAAKAAPPSAKAKPPVVSSKPAAPAPSKTPQPKAPPAAVSTPKKPSSAGKAVKPPPKSESTTRAVAQPPATSVPATVQPPARAPVSPTAAQAKRGGQDTAAPLKTPPKAPTPGTPNKAPAARSSQSQPRVVSRPPAVTPPPSRPESGGHRSAPKFLGHSRRFEAALGWRDGAGTALTFRSGQSLPTELRASVPLQMVRPPAMRGPEEEPSAPAVSSFTRPPVTPSAPKQAPATRAPTTQAPKTQAPAARTPVIQPPAASAGPVAKATSPATVAKPPSKSGKSAEPTVVQQAPTQTPVKGGKPRSTAATAPQRPAPAVPARLAPQPGRLSAPPLAASALRGVPVQRRASGSGVRPFTPSLPWRFGEDSALAMGGGQKAPTELKAAVSMGWVAPSAPSRIEPPPAAAPSSAARPSAPRPSASRPSKKKGSPPSQARPTASKPSGSQKAKTPSPAARPAQASNPRAPQARPSSPAPVSRPSLRSASRAVSLPVGALRTGARPATLRPVIQAARTASSAARTTAPTASAAPRPMASDTASVPAATLPWRGVARQGRTSATTPTELKAAVSMGWVAASAPAARPELPQALNPVAARSSGAAAPGRPAGVQGSGSQTTAKPLATGQGVSSPSASTAERPTQSAPAAAPARVSSPARSTSSAPESLPWRGVGEAGLALRAGQRMPTELKAAVAMGWVTPSRSAAPAQPATSLSGPNPSQPAPASARPAQTRSTQTRSAQNAPRWPKPGEVMQLRGEAGSHLRSPAVSQADGEPAPKAQRTAPRSSSRSPQGPLRWPKPGEVMQLRGDAGSYLRPPAVPEAPTQPATQQAGAPAGTSPRSPQNSPRWPKPGEVMQLRGDAGSYLRPPAVTEAPSEPLPQAEAAPTIADSPVPVRRQAPTESGTLDTTKAPSKQAAGHSAGSQPRGPSLAPPGAGSLAPPGVLRAPEGMPRSLSGPAGVPLKVPARPPAEETQANRESVSGRGPTPSRPGPRKAAAQAKSVQRPTTASPTKATVRSRPATSRKTGWRTPALPRATPLSLTSPHGDTQPNVPTWGRAPLSGAGKPRQLSSSQGITPLAIPKLPTTAGGDEPGGGPATGAVGTTSPSSPSEQRTASTSSTSTTASGARTGGSSSLSPTASGRLSAPKSVLGAPGSAIQMQSSAPRTSISVPRSSSATASHSTQSPVARAAARAGSRGLDFRGAAERNTQPATRTSQGSTSSASTTTQTIAARRGTASAGRTGAVTPIQANASTQLVRAPSAFESPASTVASPRSSSSSSSSSTSKTTFGSQAGKVTSLGSGVSRTLLATPKAKNQNRITRSPVSSNARRPRVRPTQYQADDSGPPIDWEYAEEEADQQHSWSAVPELSGRPARQAKAARTTQAPQPTAELLEELSEKQVFQALKRLTTTSPEARSILKDVKRALDDLRRLDRMRKL